MDRPGASVGVSWNISNFPFLAAMHMGDPDMSGYIFHTFSVWMAHLQGSPSVVLFLRIIKLDRTTRMEQQNSPISIRHRLRGAWNHGLLEEEISHATKHLEAHETPEKPGV